MRVRYSVVAVLAACSAKKTESHTEHRETVIVTTERLADNRRIEQDLSAQWNRDLGPVENVSCPGKIAMRVGETFTCSLAAVGGDRFESKVTLTEVDGDRLAWKTSIDEDIFIAPIQAEAVRTALAPELGVEPTVDCGRTRRVGAGDTTTCAIATADGGKAVARFKLLDGQFRWRVE